MSSRFKFLRDVPLWLKGSPDKPIGDFELRDLARELDLIVLFYDDCKAYIEELLTQLKSMNVNSDADCFRPIPDEELDELVAAPFSDRSVEDLRRFRLELIASNPVAMNQLFRRLASAPLGDAWLGVYDAECRRAALRDGIGWVDHKQVADQLGIDLGEGSGIAAQSLLRGEGSGATESAPSRSIVFRWHIPADAEEYLQWDDGDASRPTAKHLDVEIAVESHYRLRVAVGGIGFVERTCELEARWLALDDELNTTTSIADQYQELVLDATSGPDPKSLTPIHVLELRFKRTSPDPYSFVARIPIRTPPRL